MIRRYPKFLKAYPEFFGLGFLDLGALMLSLYFSMIFNLNPLLSVALSGAGVLTMKVIRKNFDFTGGLLPRKKEVFISDIKRNQ